MVFFGLNLRKPTWLSMTLAAAIATLAWLVLMAVLDARGAADRVTAGAVLVALFWGCVCAAIGVRFRGPREIAFYAIGAVLLLGAYQTLAPLAA